jgi:thymidylate synthase (FAD)
MQQARTHRVGVSFDVQCLAGDTEITFLQAGGGLRKIRIAELHDLWTNGERATRHRPIQGRQGQVPGTYRRDCRKRLQKMRLRVLNEDTKIFETSHLKEVTCSGLQPVYRLTMEDGRTLDCTANHRLLTPDGWQTMGEALSLVVRKDGNVSSFRRTAQLLANGKVAAGSGAYRDRSWLQKQVKAGATPGEMAERASCSITTIRDWARRHQIRLNQSDRRFQSGNKPWNHNPSALYRQQAWLQQRLEDGLHADEMAELAGCSLEAIKKWVYHFGLTLNRRPPGFQAGMQPWNKDRRGLRGSEHQLHAHHLVPVYADPNQAYEIKNLVTLCQPCHTLIHKLHQEADFAATYNPHQPLSSWSEKPRSRSRRLMAHPLTVVDVKFLGSQMTYDIEVEEPWHNFVANGLVVHNSMRYTGDRIRKAANGAIDLEEVFYLRPVGDYSDRQGKKYTYTADERAKDLALCRAAAERYAELLDAGFAEEHARGILPFDYRQHFVVSFSLRAFLHFLDLRAKLDAQQEIRELCDLMWPHLVAWAPQFAEWYEKSRLHKARLAP